MKYALLNKNLKYILTWWCVFILSGCAPRITNYVSLSYDIHQRILTTLENSGLHTSFRTSQYVKDNLNNNIRWSTLHLKYTLPTSADWKHILNEIQRRIPDASLGLTINQYKHAPPENLARIAVSKKDLLLAEIIIQQKVLGIIAFVIDDVGSNNRALQAALMIDRPITYAVLPRLVKSRKLAELFYERGNLILLHQPMASVKNFDPGPGAIMPEMNERDIVKTLEYNLKVVPYVSGVNNHMGSLITPNKDLMRIIFTYLKSRNLFYLDSVTEINSCADVARELEYPIYKRDYFIDNEHKIEYIKGQIDLLIKRVKKHGYAIGIGHFYPITLQCIFDKIPELENEGIKLVYVDEIPRN